MARMHSIGLTEQESVINFFTDPWRDRWHINKKMTIGWCFTEQHSTTVRGNTEHRNAVKLQRFSF